MADRARILVLGGDGIGPEVTAAGVEVLKRVAPRAGLALDLEEDLLGGCSWDAHGTFCRDAVVAKARAADAILVGAVGGPKWDSLDVPGTPSDKDGLIRLRKELDTFACLRPARSYPALAARTPFRDVAGVDLLVLRELCGGVYFGAPRGIRALSGGGHEGFDNYLYASGEIARVARVGLEIARRRGRGMVSLDKANVMESGVLWRRVVSEVGAAEYPDVPLRHLYADNALYQLVRDPRSFDVMLGDNLLGDLFSDLVAAFAGSLGMLPSASLHRLEAPGRPSRPGIFEPVHGTAPDIAGRGIANPLGAILSVAMLFEYGLGLPAPARAIEAAVDATLADGVLTPDLGGSADTASVTRAVLGHLG